IYALGATSAYYTLRDRLSILRNAGVVVGSVLRPISAFAGIVALGLVIPWNPTRRVEAAVSSNMGRARTSKIEYVFTDLGTFGGSESEARYINSAGEIVGWALDSNDMSRAFVWRNGQLSLLPMRTANEDSDAWAVNDAGVIVGFLMPSGDGDHRQ